MRLPTYQYCSKRNKLRIAFRAASLSIKPSKFVPRYTDMSPQPIIDILLIRMIGTEPPYEAMGKRQLS